VRRLLAALALVTLTVAASPPAHAATPPAHAATPPAHAVTPFAGRTTSYVTIGGDPQAPYSRLGLLGGSKRVVRDDHRLFVDAFRNHEIAGL